MYLTWHILFFLFCLSVVSNHVLSMLMCGFAFVAFLLPIGRCVWMAWFGGWVFVFLRMSKKKLTGGWWRPAWITLAWPFVGFCIYAPVRTRGVKGRIFLNM
ncbi:hypothetical protein GE09DRAFT_1145532 [Coniochaeta sp. 2T2.1]|nr:hypothetical protein GE09DRAFT_1145532 [Coniochaeta sp. 2T2.1]